jgi:malate/lactate dehydrogenase
MKEGGTPTDSHTSGAPMCGKTWTMQNLALNSKHGEKMPGIQNIHQGDNLDSTRFKQRITTKISIQVEP